MISPRHSLTREGGGILLEDPQFVSQLGHGVAHHQLLVLVLGLEVRQRNLGRVLVRFEYRSQGGDLFSLRREQTLELDDLFMQIGDLLLGILVACCHVRHLVLVQLDRVFNRALKVLDLIADRIDVLLDLHSIAERLQILENVRLRGEDVGLELRLDGGQGIVVEADWEERLMYVENKQSHKAGQR